MHGFLGSRIWQRQTNTPYDGTGEITTLGAMAGADIFGGFMLLVTSVSWPAVGLGAIVGAVIGSMTVLCKCG